MSLRNVFRREREGQAIREEPTEVGQDAFTAVAEYYDSLMAAVPYARWVDYVERILERFGARPHDVLDLCCGTGAVGGEMLRRGYNAVGVDLAEGMVRRCCGRRPPLAAAVMDAAALGLRETSLDLVVSLYDSLNYITEVEGLASCFRGVAHALRPGGLFIFDLNTPRALRSGFFTQDNLRSGEPLLYWWQAHWDESRKLCRVDMRFRWRGEGDTTEFREIHYERAYEDGEVRSMLESAGLTVLAVYDAYGFRPASRLSTRLYYVARNDTPGNAEHSLGGIPDSSR